MIMLNYILSIVRNIKIYITWMGNDIDYGILEQSTISLVIRITSDMLTIVEINLNISDYYVQLFYKLVFVPWLT